MRVKHGGKTIRADGKRPGLLVRDEEERELG